MNTLYKCERCGKVCDHECSYGGSIEHENLTDEYNLSGAVERGEIIEFMDLRDDTHYKNDEFYSKDVEDIHKCQFIWLKQNNINLYNKAIDYFNERKLKVETLEPLMLEYNNITGYNPSDYYVMANKFIDIFYGIKDVKFEKCESLFKNNYGDKKSYYIATIKGHKEIIDFDDDDYDEW